MCVHFIAEMWSASTPCRALRYIFNEVIFFSCDAVKAYLERCHARRRLHSTMTPLTHDFQMLKSILLHNMATCIDYHCDPARATHDGHLLLGDSKGNISMSAV